MSVKLWSMVFIYLFVCLFVCLFTYLCCEGHWEGNASMKVFGAGSVTMKWHLSQLIRCSLTFGLLLCMAW
jgi:hypothetical protein